MGLIDGVAILAGFGGTCLVVNRLEYVGFLNLGSVRKFL
jgi:hypothetical protein